MTTVLERVVPVAPPPPTGGPSRLRRWWSAWRVAIRLARRDAWRGKGRALLVVLLIALPVAAVAAGLTYQQATERITSTNAVALRSLGTVADARLVPQPAPVQQSIAANVTSSGRGAAPTPAQLLAALPPRSRLVPEGGPTQVVAEAGPWGVRSWLEVVDTREPMNAGRWVVLAGRLPTSTSEVALGADDARRLQVGIGDSVRLTATSGADRVVTPTIVGLVRPFDASQGIATGVIPPGVIDVRPDEGPQERPQYLVTTPVPLTWAEVRALNAIGAAVVSRSVLESPPAFCPSSDELCLDSGPAAQPDPGAARVSPAELERAARTAALAVVVVVLIVLQVALLAGPAFAVQLRRRQRELGLLGASGGSSADLRRTVLASGVVLGAAGGVLGIAMGWSAVQLLGGLLPWAPLAAGGVPIAVAPLPGRAVGVAFIGLIAAVTASLVPAIIAGRSDTVGSLRGRRPLPPLRARTPMTGLLLGVAGVAVMAYGRSVTDGLVMVVGILLGELGLVMVMPWLVVQCGRVAGRLPLSSRMAVRDAGRHRLRTAAATCAVAAAAAAGVAVSTWATSTTYLDQNTEVALPPDTVAIQTLDSDSRADDAATLSARLQRAVAAVDPGARAAHLTAATAKVPAGPSSTASELGQVGCVVPAGPGGATWLPCSGRSTANSILLGDVVVLQDPADLALVLGPIVDPAAGIAELERGGAVVLQPDALDAQGRVALRSSVVHDDGSTSDTALTRLPGIEVLEGALPASVILGPKALRGTSIATDPYNQMLLVHPAEQERADRPTIADQLDLSLAKARLDATVISVFHDPISSDAFALIVYGAGALLLTLLAGLMVTALALVDARSDLSTLAAVGAEPRVRRRFSASSAGFVAALGCLTGVMSGLVLAWLLNPLFNRFGSSTVVVHGWLVAFVLIGVPLLTAAVAWLSTRSRIPLTRRPD